MSEQQAEQTGHEPGSLGAGSAVPNSSDARIDTPPQGDAPRADGPKADALKNDRPNPDTAETDAAGAGATRPPRELLILSPGEGTWERS
jgi:hypothetical protein